MSAQTSFLRCLQERTVRPLGSESEIGVDIRVIAATHRDLDQRVEENLFRKDLLYRIRATEIKLPPLRKRENDREDIPMAAALELKPSFVSFPDPENSDFEDMLSVLRKIQTRIKKQSYQHRISDPVDWYIKNN